MQAIANGIPGAHHLRATKPFCLAERVPQGVDIGVNVGDDGKTHDTTDVITHLLATASSATRRAPGSTSANALSSCAIESDHAEA